MDSGGGLSSYYAHHDESRRLDAAEGRVELVRTQELLRGKLPLPPAQILDIGGADGVHARWLTGDGYDVVIVDVVPGHVDQARAQGFAAQVGDARTLEFGDAGFDAVLLLGPLYHLRDRADRVQAIREARRVLKPGGLLAAAAINRISVALHWYRAGARVDEVAREVVRRIAIVGLDDTGHGEGLFFFHTVADLEQELHDAGCTDVTIRGVEGPAWPLLDPSGPREDPAIFRVLEIARLADLDPATAGASCHLLAFSYA